MGYLSQKKKHARINFLLNTSLGIISITSFLALFDRSSGFSAFINQWQFQIYIYLLFVFFYALANRFFIQALFACLLIVVNYMSIASSANLFKNIENDGQQRLVILYQNHTRNGEALLQQARTERADVIAVNRSQLPGFDLSNYPGYYLFNEDNDWKNSFMVSRHMPLKSGKLRLSPRFTASYMSFIAEEQPLVLINIDLSGLSHRDEKTVYHNLAEFVTAQDNPVIIIGEFGIPAWSDTFKKFLNKTGLEVKNRVILSNGSCWFNPFGVPSLNVLAYKNFGVKDVSLLNKDGNARHPLLVELSF